MLPVIARIQAKPGKEAELEALLRGLVAPTRKEAGCLQYDLHVEKDHSGTFVFIERWDSEESLVAHLESRHIQAGMAQKHELIEVLDIWRLAPVQVADANIAPRAVDEPPLPLTGKKLFIGNLPYIWTEDQLREQFAPHGTIVNAVIARFRGRGGRSRGFGFVEMTTEDEAQAAIAAMHDGLAGDRKMIVRLARDQESRTESAEAPAPIAPDGNTVVPAESATSTTRPARPARPSRGGRGRGGRGGRNRGPRPEPRNPSAAPASRPRRETGISNSSGYEIFPRDNKGGFNSEPTERSADRPRSIESSPYMDDTGDIDNRGNRRPRR
jgi:quinol monooxygenase YgiN/RNA recognition motif-containing protein